MSETSKAYNSKDVEERIYKYWEDSGFFSPEKSTGKEKFVIVIPPPNVTGSLHMGHALDNTIQDILIRYKRMRGFKTLWLPGTDHAGIATQNVVEKELKKEGKKKEDIGREDFIKKVWEWKEKYGGTITRQLRRLGASCDWSRERFTMDKGLSKAVRKAFVTLYKEGLIYKGKRMVNWCPRCGTAISDIEVEHESKKGHLWYIKYPIDKSKIQSSPRLSSGQAKSKINPNEGNSKAQTEEDFIVVATTRPETMLGDTAVAVNPNDERFAKLVGMKLTLPLVGRKIPVVADDFVDPAFGTGAVKVTPSHDPNDYEIAQRHQLPSVNILTEKARITLEEFNDDGKKFTLKYEGLDRQKAREEIVKDLEEKGFILKIEDYENNIGRCYRCKTDIEPYLSPQWFVKVAPLKEKAIQSVIKGDIKYIPSRWGKVYLDWMENLHDWCISRQIWWGHRIPVWYCPCGEVIASEEDPKKCPSCGRTDLNQDEDVLDTWFSSSLWPFSTLGWPDDTSDLKEFYPTSVLVTGYDIITFWVSKMIMMGLKFMDRKPFHKVFIHGLIRDLSGKKMSKSLGNVIDPTEVIERVGADALRFSLVSLVTSGGQDLKLSEEKITEGRNFANKIWNVSRFVLMHGEVDDPKIDDSILTLADRWILHRLNRVIASVSDNLENFEFGEAARALYDFIWSEFCDWYTEFSKISIYGKTADQKLSAEGINTLKILRHILKNILKLLHPFMPFETEEIWQKFYPDKTIMLEAWPESDKKSLDEEAEKNMQLLTDVIRAVRNIRAEMNIAPGLQIKVSINAHDKIKTLKDGTVYLKSLAKIDKLDISESSAKMPDKCASAVVSNVEIYIPLEGLIDFEKELQRLAKAKDEIEGLINRTKAKLENKDFISRAKEELVRAEEEKLKEYLGKRSVLSERIAHLSKD